MIFFDVGLCARHHAKLQYGGLKQANQGWGLKEKKTRGVKREWGGEDVGKSGWPLADRKVNGTAGPTTSSPS